MPADTINIYVDNSFLSTSSGATDTSIEYVSREADSIGDGTIRTLCTLSAGVSGIFDLNTLCTITHSGALIDTGRNIDNKVQFNVLSSGITSDYILEYRLPTTSSGLFRYIDVSNKCEIRSSLFSGFLPFRSQVMIGNEKEYFTSTLLNFFVPHRIDLTNDFVLNYTSPSGLFDIRDIAAKSTFADFPNISGALNAYVDSFFAGYIFHYSPTQIICGMPSVVFGSDFEVLLASGSLPVVRFSAAAGVESYGLLSTFDVCAGDFINRWVNFYTEVIPGRIAYLVTESFCGIENTSNFINFDVDLLSLKISDLSIAEGEFVNADGTLCVDITDDVHDVIPDGCYFVLDGTVISGTFSPIIDGYRMCYSPVDDFGSILNTVEFKVVASNDNGDVLTKRFYLTSGYRVFYDNVDQDYGQGNKIVIRMSAENFTSCPAVGVFAYEVETVAKESRDLLASIIAEPAAVSVDLPAVIYPNSTAYFYGKIMKVEVRAKDYAGNEMEPFIFEFRIEDKPL